MGKSPDVQQVEKGVPPEEIYERYARERLTGNAYTSAGRAGQYYDMADILASPQNIQQTTLDTMAQQNAIRDQMGNISSTLAGIPAQYVEVMNRYRPQQETLMSQWSNNNPYTDLSRGVLGQEFYNNMKQAIEQPVNDLMGNTLNTLANRGVVNSSVTQRAMGDIAKQAAAQTAQSYNQGLANAIAAAQGQTQDRAGQVSGWNSLNDMAYKGIGGQTQAVSAAGDMLSDQALTSMLPLQSLTSAGQYLTGTGDNYQKQLTDLYALWRNSRYSVPDDTVVSQPTSPVSAITSVLPFFFL